jgi:hypothetical protein
MLRAIMPAQQDLAGKNNAEDGKKPSQNKESPYEGRSTPPFDQRKPLSSSELVIVTACRVYHSKVPRGYCKILRCLLKILKSIPTRKRVICSGNGESTQNIRQLTYGNATQHTLDDQELLSAKQLRESQRNVNHYRNQL